MTTNCTFCDWEKKSQNHIFDNELFFAQLDNFPVTPGDVLIIPRRHVVDISSLTSAEWQLSQQTVNNVINVLENMDLKKKYEEMLNKPISEISTWFCEKAIHHPRINTKPDAYNHGINDGKAAGRTIDHFHWHIIPRFTGDMDDPRGGVRHVIPDMGNYKIPR